MFIDKVTYKVIIAGGREFNDYALLEREMLDFLEGREMSEVEIVSGTARGADKLGEKFGLEYDVDHRVLAVIPAVRAGIKTKRREKNEPQMEVSLRHAVCRLERGELREMQALYFV